MSVFSSMTSMPINPTRHPMKDLKLALLSVFALLTLTVSAQMAQPVKVTTQLKVISPTQAQILFDATIDHGWHMYSTEVVEYGPTPTTLTIESIEGATLSGALHPASHPTKKYEEMFGADVFFFTDKATFIQDLKITSGKPFIVSGYLEYGACDDHSCIPPTKIDFSLNATAANDEATTAPSVSPEDEQFPNLSSSAISEDSTTVSANVPSVSPEGQNDSTSVAISPSLAHSQPASTEDNPTSSSLLHIFLLGLLGGLVALITPCVWPIIPMTVSFFLKRSSDKRRGIRDAVIYGISIVVIYLALGLIVTAIFGASALNALATNAVFNIFFFLLLVVFALSFFGLFELRLPASWSTKVDNKAERAGGLFGIFLMAFTLTLVSFSCTGPIIGFLLVEVSTMGNILGPAVGMLGFALALGIPFALFAMFPSWLKQMPKSGGWMDTVKIVLGFIELFFSLKFLSVADLAYGWHILDRDYFIAIWILLALALGLYLLGIYHFPHEQQPKNLFSKDKEQCHIGWVRLLLGILSLLFAVWMVPGLWGKPLKEISAFTPPMSTQHWFLEKNSIEARSRDYSEGIAIARAEHKPVIIDFTGFGCVNCRKMEAAVWTDPAVAHLLQDDYVLIQLFVDDKAALSEIITVTEGGQAVKLRTIGDKWSYLQRSKFGANAQPFYVLIDPSTEQLLAEPYGFDEDVDHYVEFLTKGLNKYKETNNQ